MKEGFIKCPLCGRPVGLIRRTGQMAEHYASFGKPGVGFHGSSEKCKASFKRPEEAQ